MADDGESLESWLNKATNPSNREEDWEYIMGFCDKINKELEGPQISVRLLAHKIQSPQEWEAIQALMVLEACMKNCGQRFHSEVGKFRFLNELIKVVSPKYLGDKVSEKVKSKVIEVLYSWTVSLPDETKICEAYQMLKSQGIVLVNPEIPLDVALVPSPSPRTKNPVFDDEKRSKRLAELLKSKKPEDLQEANRLIKNMVKEDEVRTQKVRKQKSTLEAVNNSVKLLNEMLAHFSPDDSTDSDKELIGELYNDCDKLRQTVAQLATESEDNDSSLGDILQASDDLSHVINSYKKIVKGQNINGETEAAQQTSGKQGSGSTNQSEILIDLVGLGLQSPSTPENQPLASSVAFPTDLLSGSAAAEAQSPSPSAISGALSLLDEELLFLGLNDPVENTAHAQQSKSLSSFQDPSQDLFDTSLPSGPTSTYSLCPDALSSSVAPFSPNKSSSAASALSFSKPVLQTSPVFTESFATTSVMFLQPLTSGQTLLPQSLSMTLPPPSAMHVSTSLTAPHSLSSSVSEILQDLSLLDLSSPKNAAGVLDFGSPLVKSEDLHTPATMSLSPGISSTTSTSLLMGQMQGSSNPPSVKSQEDDCPLLHSDSPMHPVTHASPGSGQDMSLANVFVPLDAIRPSNVCPVTAYDKNGVRVLLHFASDCPPGRPDVLVMVTSMLNTAPQPVRSIVLQAAVPKTMKVRLQPPSGTELAPFNPILPPAAITQVILLANPLKEKVRMRYKLTFTLGEQPLTEVWEVNEFPPADRWGAL
ncbi:ADP-ribosylation factor-binding GGA3-like isoform X1 [Solea senegalensis]|uniref:ADP-ribosylation factor-binding GGA3-like isoform X1 n=1 Tax=Solea senegalensis TaxID=28829 RepID=A0AAV6Q8D1_SOLSE|nr:ADP-ribosylation factor-binding protein GGA3a isoform X1 [Solea senegalensis]KAG7485893.1 ADP-ribosylation factor-binding GGA3-like isoform X1 [Solea senegalensis]